MKLKRWHVFKTIIFMFIEIYDGITPILGYFLDYENKL